MKSPVINLIKVFSLAIALHAAAPAHAHEIYFCGEAIPTSRDFVANKLMNVIRNQIPAVTLASLRYQAQRYFPAITARLKYYDIPEDFKYIPIVECGFRNNLSSGAGARGFWQLMPEVAKKLNLVVLPGYDERDDPRRATEAACQLIREHYGILKSKLHTSSWVLTAAAYNFGPSNILKTVKRQGTDYFNMQLNAETAEYVYRLIAVKELFEHPELYMNGFGANIFSNAGVPELPEAADINNLERGPAIGAVNKDFTAIDFKVAKEGDTLAPKTKSFLVIARIVSDGKPFRDGSLITFELLGDLELSDSFRKKGNKIKGQGWLIDGRVYIDLGYGYEVEVQDKMEQKGLTPASAATNKEYVLLKTEIPVE